MAPDYYVVLGVAHDASLSQIRRAFRELSRRLDPDHPASVSSNPVRFEDASRAYDALTHPAERAAHDSALVSRSASAPPGSSGPAIGPPRHLLDDFDEHRPSREEIRQALEREGLGPMPKACRFREVGVEVVLAPAQAQAGGVIPFGIPAATPCATCGGTGRTGFFHCDACGGAGARWHDARVDVVVPRGTPPGTRVPVSLKAIGIDSLALNVTIRTSPDA
jgi:molecular chaperone DnaJ